MAEYVKDVEKFREGTPLALFCQAVPYMERDPTIWTADSSD